MLRIVRARARARHLDVTLLRKRAAHEIWQVGRVAITLPRHVEVSAGVERAIKRDLETELGQDWWKR